MKDLISVIIIAYNMEQFIDRAVKCVEKQTYPNIEIIIVDDGSTDNTLDICNKLAKTNDHIKVIHQNNSGQASARKTGVLHATGDYIGFMDADDTITPDMYEFLLSIAKEYDAEIAHCGYTMIRPNGKRKDYYGTGNIVKQNHDQGLIDLFEAKIIEPTACTKLYKRHLFENINFHTDIRINEDLMLNFTLFSKSQSSVFIDDCKYNYIKREGSMSSAQSVRQFTDPIKVKEHIYKKCHNEKESVQKAAKHLLAAQYIISAYSIKTNGYKEYLAVYKECKKELRKIYKTSSLTNNEIIKALIILYAPCLCKTANLFYGFLQK